MEKQKRTSRMPVGKQARMTREAVLIRFFIVILSCLQGAMAWADPKVVNRELLRQEIRSELEKMINEEGIFDQAIERAIDSFLSKQLSNAGEARQKNSDTKAGNVRPVSPQDHLYGDPAAEISLLEYSDFECGFCKRFHPTARQLVDQSDGSVNWVYRHYPLAFHNPGAQRQAEASECAAELGGNEAFWRYASLLFQRTAANGTGFPAGGLVSLAAELGLDEARFTECLESGRMAQRVASDQEDGRLSGIRGTPGNILLHNGSGDTLALTGAVSLSRLRSAVNTLQQRHSPDKGR